MNQQRIGYFDIAKGIGMICVILGHLSVNGINMVVFTFHMPLFFLISGYFMKKKEWKSFAIDRFRQLMLPYFATCVMLMILSPLADIALGRSNEIIGNLKLWLYASLYGSGNTYTKPFYIKQIGALWFLPAMWISAVLYNGLMDKKWCTPAVVILALIGYVTVRYIYLPMSMQSAMLALIFVHAGFMVRKKRLLDQKHQGICVIVAIAIWGICVYLDHGKFYLVGNYSENLPIDIAGALAGCYIVIIQSRLIERIPVISSALKWFGQNSLIILCFHLIELTFFPWRLFCHVLGINNDYLAAGLIVSGKFIWSIICTIVVLKTPFLLMIFRGGRKTE